jgi:peptidoglycan-associated lipoprotein
MHSKISFYLSLLAVVFLVTGCSMGARITKADKRYEVGEYFNAGEMYRNIYSNLTAKEKPLRARIAFQQAECSRLTNNFARAEQAYLNAIRNNYPDSIVFLRYAQSLQRNGKYADAAKNYSIYLQHDSTNVMAKNGVRSAQLVAEWRNTTTRYVVRRTPEFYVRRVSTFSPAFAGSGGDLLVFTSSRSVNKKAVQKNSAITGLPNNDVFISKKNAAGKWELPEPIEGDINSNNDEGVTSFSTDGKVMYFTRSPYAPMGISGTEILFSNRAGATWSTPQKIKIFKDSTISVAHPAISPDGQTLYFVSDAQNGFGGKDIWKGTLENGECKFIENLGDQINTTGDEMFPVVRADGTLYFSSNGHPGFGGLDIYKATPLKDGGWNVVNIGAPVNSPADDFGMTFEANAEKGFFSSNRDDLKGLDAIWSFELPELAYFIEGKVVDEKGEVIPDASVRMVSNTGVNARVQTKKNGTYRIKVDKDMECVMLASARGYLNQKNSLSTQGLTQSKTFTIDFKLSSISKPVQMDNIFYEFGKWDLTPASETGLQALVKMMNDNPNITIEIAAHTDYVGNNAANKTLSERRAKSVVDYLIGAGIAAARLTSVGYGEEKPVVVDAALEQKYNFLKENDVLDENYITKLTAEQQEQANQINRRTEFRVVKTTYSSGMYNQ